MITWLVLLSLLLAFTLGEWIVCSYFEAQRYHNLTGNHVSTWEAMWLDLRVK